MKRTNCKKSGYLRITLREESGRKVNARVHRLILEAFHGPAPESDSEGCHHPDPDKRNCRIANLRWDTHRANLDDMASLGRRASKLSLETVRKIRGELASGVKGAEIARREGVHPKTIGSIKSGKSWRDCNVADQVS